MKTIHTKNADYQKLMVLKTNRNKRHKYGQFIVEGVRNINEAVRNCWRIDAFLYPLAAQLSSWASATLDSCPGAERIGLEPALMAELSGKEDTSELMAVARMREDRPESLPLGDRPLLALFDRPSNKGNLGTLIRSCDALGVDALILTGHGVDLYDPDTIVSSMGSFFNCLLYTSKNCRGDSSSPPRRLHRDVGHVRLIEYLPKTAVADDAPFHRRHQIMGAMAPSQLVEQSFPGPRR